MDILLLFKWITKKQRKKFKIIDQTLNTSSSQNNNPNQKPNRKSQTFPKKTKRPRKKNKKGGNNVTWQSLAYPNINKKIEQQQKQLNQINQKAINLIHQMNQAYLKDNQEYKNNKSALAKHKLLHKVITKLYNFQLKFLQNDGLLEIEKWLEKRSDGADPPINMKTQLFQLIYRLPIQYQHLDKIKTLQSVIQKNRYSPYKQIKVLADKIINRWKRIKKQDYKDFQSFYEYIQHNNIDQTSLRKKQKRR